MKRLQLLFLLLCPLVLSGCGAVVGALADVAVNSAVDSVFDHEDDQEKNDVRYHLQHGDTVREAQQGAAEDALFRDMMRM